MNISEPMTDASIFDWLTAWAGARNAVRAAILTSTRTHPGATLDRFSDYDIILFVRDIAPWLSDEGWLADFGPVLTLYRDPVRPWHGEDTFCRVTQYEDRHEDRLQRRARRAVGEAAAASPELDENLDDGYTVLVDKDRLAAGLKPPTYRAYIPSPPPLKPTTWS